MCVGRGFFWGEGGKFFLEGAILLYDVFFWRGVFWGRGDSRGINMACISVKIRSYQSLK